jgi:putative nucleotidyltransferase with HDIG domain
MTAVLSDEDPPSPLELFVQGTTDLLPFPVVAQNIIVELSHTDYNLATVRRLMESDPALTVKVLRTANSMMAAGTANCASVHHAILCMGTIRVRDAVVAVATLEGLSKVPGHGRRLRNHSAAVGAIARAMAQTLRLPHTGQAFLAGLLHDAGKLLLLQSGASDHITVEDKDTPVHLLEREALGFDHADLGAHILALWGMPDPVPEVVGRHHLDASCLEDAGRSADCVAVLQLSDTIEHLFRGKRTLPMSPRLLHQLLDDPGASWLSLNERQLNQVWPVIEREIRAARKTYA